METMDAFDGVEAGRRLGHDLHRWSRLPLQPEWPTSVREGFEEAAARRGARLAGDRFSRKWLQLRLGAWHRQRSVAADVTPAVLRMLDVTHCPVTRALLTHGTREETDASVDRLNNDGGYAPGNLAVISVRANRAKGALGFEDVLARGRGEVAAIGSALTQDEWLRLAVLMQGPAFATRQHLAPLLPLVAPLPCLSVRLAIQQIQRLFTLQAARPAGKNALVKAFMPAAATDRVQQRLKRLGDAVHEGLKQVAPEQQHWDVWLQPHVMDALTQWRESLSNAEWAAAAQISGRVASSRRFTPASLAAWHIPTQGDATRMTRMA